MVTRYTSYLKTGRDSDQNLNAFQSSDIRHAENDENWERDICIDEISKNFLKNEVDCLNLDEIEESKLKNDEP